MKTILEGNRIFLRPPVKSDEESIYIHARHREISRYTHIPYPYTRDDAYRFIKDCKRWWRSKRIHSFGIVWKETGKVIGMISLFRIDSQNRNAEIGYWLAKKYWGQGITHEAINLVLTYGFNVLMLERIYARVMHPNLASARLLKKTGFVKEGYFRKTILQKRGWLDEYRFAILKSDFKKNR